MGSIGKIADSCDSKVTILLKEKESVAQSVFKDFVTFSFIGFCIYISQGKL